MTTLPSPVEMIRELVAQPSVSAVDPAEDTSNRAVVDRIATWAEDLGFEVEILDVPGAPGKVNLVASLGRGPAGLVLSGHTDTVPWDEGAWTHDPFAATERDGRLFGLGTADMKGFFGVALEAARAFRADTLSEPLVLLATADEECTMAGARALVEAGRPAGRRAVIGEPTGLVPIRAHKGVLFEILRVRGRTGHSSDPSLGDSALEGMHRVIGALLSLREELRLGHRDEGFAVPEPTMNLGRIRGGDAANRICAECELYVDMRLLPGMAPADLQRRVGEAARGALAGTRLELDHVSAFPGVPPFRTDATAELVRAAEELTGHASETVMFGTEGPYLQQLGMETIVLGGGSIAVAHQPDEFLPLADVARATDVYRRLIQRYCVAP